MNINFLEFGMNHPFNAAVGLDYSGPVMEMAYEADDSYQEMDSMYASSMAAQYCQPYLDHSYASQLPAAASAPDITSLTVSEPLTSYIDIEDVSCHTTVVTAPMGGGGGGVVVGGGGGGGVGVSKSMDNFSNDPWEGSVTRCICDFQHDDGYMICCDRCGVWQHVDCMGVDRNNIPESYLCELCSPRLVDKRRAIRLQTLKKEQMDVEASLTDSSTEERYGTGKRGGKRRVGRKRRDSQSGITPNKRARQRTTSEPVGERATEMKKNAQASMQNQSAAPKRTRRSTMDTQRNVTIDHSQEDQCPNTYSTGVLLLLATLKQTDLATSGLSASFNTSVFKEQISKPRYRIVQCEANIKGVEATEAIRTGQVVAEYTGHVMMLDEHQPVNQLNMHMPFLLQYTGTESFRFSFCIDSGAFGSDIRFIRSSCTPNCKVLHVVEQNAVRFFVCATKSILEGRELTIPFSYDYTKSSNEVKCACARAACSVARFFKNKTNSRPVRTGRGKSLSSNSEEEKSKADALLNAPAVAEKAAPPSSIKQRRRSSLRSEMHQQDLTMSQDVGADINLINKLTATVQQPVPQVALTSNCTSEVCAISSDSWKNDENHAAENQLIPPFPSLDLNDTDGGSLVIATREESTPLRKTREQKKIDAVEKTFQKIEKVNSRGREASQRTKSAKATTQNEVINEDKRKKLPNARSRGLHNSETNQIPPRSATNGGGRTSARAKKLHGKHQSV